MPGSIELVILDRRSVGLHLIAIDDSKFNVQQCPANIES